MKDEVNRKDFEALSGPWAGMSIQDGRRIAEKMRLSMFGASFRGEGTDADGEFTLEGSYDKGSDIVMITRRYTFSPESPDQVGYPYTYLGKWDGQMVWGRWFPSTNPSYGGPFEMWPEREEDVEELAIQLEEEVLTMPGPLR